MSCYRPLDGYRREGGGVSVEYEPVGSTAKVLLPCGRCLGCRMDYARQWSIRARHEASLWDQNMFLTLTYDEDHVPTSLQPRHLSLFLKRLRRSYTGEAEAPDGRRPIRYFAAGEYGSWTKRPHYHLLLFNLRLSVRDQLSATTWDSPEIADLWPHGSHAIGSVTPASAAYVCQYSVKKVRGRLEAKRHYEWTDPKTGEVIDRTPEFVRMSTQPGLGYWWFEKFRSDLKRGYVIQDGVRHPVPRFYMRQLAHQDAELAYDIEVRKESYVLEAEASTDETREAAEATHMARRGLFTPPRADL